MLTLELIGTYRPEALRTLLHDHETLEHFPYAVLGDFSLRIHTERNVMRGEELVHSLTALGYEVIGCRWKREVPAARPVRSEQTEPKWYARLLGGH